MIGTIRLPVPAYKGTIVAVDGEYGIIGTNARGEHQALLTRAHADYDNYEDADGNPIIGPHSLCDAVAVNLCPHTVCEPCKRACILVPDALAAEPGGTPLSIDEYVPADSPDEPGALPDVQSGTGGAITIGRISKSADCSPGFWDNIAENGVILPETPDGYTFVEVDLYPSYLGSFAVDNA